MKRKLLTMVAMILSVSFAFAQRTVSGQVTSADDGSGIPGVNVILKGTTTGTTTDLDGNYRVSVPEEGGKLVFTFIGLSPTEVSIGARSVVDVQMTEDVEQLSEVVVTALGIEREARNIGYGMSIIESEELTRARESNIVNSLQGKVTGVQITNTGGNVGGSSKITIRGVSSLSGRNNPLWIVDGMMINNSTTSSGSQISGNRDFANGASVINPDDVESINVLKGAAATALYGSRAAAGAIVVTTKRGKKGKDGNATVTVNSSLRFDNLFVTPDYQGQYAMGSNGKYDSLSQGFDWGPRIVGQTVENLPVTGETGALESFDNNGIDEFFKTGVTAINNISIGDADERMNYRLSVSSLNQSGVLPGSALDRLTVGLNAGVKHSEKLSSRFGVQYIKSTSQGTGVTGANDPNIIGLGSFSSNLDQRLFRDYRDASGNQINTLQRTPDGTALTNNPYWVQFENSNDRDDDRVLGNIEVSFKPIEGLTLMARAGIDFEDDKRFIENSKGTAQRIDGTYDSDNIRRQEITSDIIASYTKDINSDITINALAGFQYNDRMFERQRIQGTALLIPELFSPANAQQTIAIRDFSQQRLFGAYGSAEVIYRNWLTLTATARNDWSSTLPVDNNSYFYPSVSAAFVFTDAFNIANNVLSYGKLRASFAQVGNDTGPYQLNFNFFPVLTATGQYSLNANFPFNGQLAYRATTQIPPTNLLPEQQTSFEFGLETQLFDGKIGLDVTYFKNQNDNQILALPIPQTTGFSSRLTNVGRVDQEGIEISINATPIEIGDFSWNTVLNFSHVESIVVELADGLSQTGIASAFNSVQVVAVPGKEFQLFAIPFLRDTITGRPVIDEATGRRIPGQAKTMGSVLPDFTGGWINNFTWKGLTLSSTIDVRWGGIMKTSTVEGLQTGGLAAETLLNRGGTFIDTDGVILDADGNARDNDVPLRNAQDFWTGLNDGSVAEPYIYDASFVKLRELGVSYSLPASVLGDSFIKGVQLGVEGRNLALLYSKVPHIDPESNLFGAGADGFGIERASVPSTRSFGFNVRLTF
ncbi:MAG: TonB-linked SusC/RagA family outer membrane protein [Paraglaciecola sp.]|jgi:TonB-linked SusC/RagA family outer membrane protein